eukprot:1019139-Rhodomonas_salina.2
MVQSLPPQCLVQLPTLHPVALPNLFKFDEKIEEKNQALRIQKQTGKGVKNGQERYLEPKVGSSCLACCHTPWRSVWVFFWGGGAHRLRQYRASRSAGVAAYLRSIPDMA